MRLQRITLRDQRLIEAHDGERTERVLTDWDNQTDERAAMWHRCISKGFRIRSFCMVREKEDGFDAEIVLLSSLALNFTTVITFMSVIPRDEQQG
jgi:hypothetical protein